MWNKFRIAKNLAKRYICSHPTFYKYFLKVENYSVYKNLINEKPDLIVDGFGGSANSYFIYSLTYSNKVILNHHLHVCGAITEGIKNNTPIVLLIRNPLDSCASLMSRDYYPNIKLVLKDYIYYHEQIEPHLEKICVLNFDLFTNNMGEAIKKVNHKFNFDLSIREGYDDYAIEKLKNEKKNKDVKAFPGAKRIFKKEDLKTRMIKDYSELLSIAQNIYTYFARN